jgi:rRNA-processing protein FCF1
MGTKPTRIVKVILDTNFLLVPGTLRVDVFTKIRELDPSAELFVVDKTIDELNKIQAEQKKFRSAAALAVQLLEQQKVKIIKTEKNKNTDLIIAETAEKNKYAVATQDKGLKKLLRQKQIPIIILRQKKYIRLE